MFGPSLYLIVCSAKNRVRVRLRRLREPRYLIGAIAGAAYLYFTIFARMCDRPNTWRAGARSSPRRGRALPPNISLEALKTSAPAFVGLGLLALMAIGWLFPSDSNLLDFTEPEIQFLFPAPVSRRQLLVHRLMRSQLGLLFASVVPAILLPMRSPGFFRLRTAVAMWLVLVTVKLHFTGITLARASLAMGHADSRRQWGALAVMLGAVTIVGGATASEFIRRPATDLPDALHRLGAVATSGLPGVILWPFTTLASPLFSAWPGPYLASLAAALLILLVNLVWVLRSDEALQEAAAQAEARLAAKKVRERPVQRARAAMWTLALSGRPEMIFLWKNGMQMLRETTVATVVRYAAPFAVLTAVSSAQMAGTRAAAIIGAVAAMVAVIAVVLGPQVARMDLRQDLLHLELLKTWPVRSSAVIRGEMLWGGVMLTSVAWVAIVCAALLLTPAFSPATLGWCVSAATSAVLVAPALVFAQLTIHNAAAVLFPAWVPLGRSRPRGLDAMGQRLVMFAGVLFGLIVMIAPAALAAGIIWFAFFRLIGVLALPMAAAVFAALVLIEVLVATEALGPVYERLDLTGVERAE